MTFRSRVNWCALLLLSCFVWCSVGDLSLGGIKCGSKLCKSHEYCSDYDRLCKPCDGICNEKNHNYDATLCIRDCQDYIHDLRYVRQDAISSNGQDLTAVIQKLQYMVTVCLTLTCFVLVLLLLILCIQVYTWKKRNNVTWSTLKSKLLFKKSDSNSKPANNGIAVAVTDQSGKPDLRLDMPTTRTHSDHSPATMTTTVSVSRRPVEDSNLDYAYDNPAMSSTPSPNSKPHESSF